METRALHIFWWQALAAPERLLDDLARYTDINTLIVDAAYLAADDPTDAPVLARVYGDRYIVPSAGFRCQWPVRRNTPPRMDSWTLRAAAASRSRATYCRSTPMRRGWRAPRAWM